jgi:KUP system potassium uptake protein
MNETQSVGEEGAKAEFRRKLKLGFASIGVVFGDIGTSPLYAMRESLAHVAGAGGNVHEDVLAVVSLLIWALILIVTIKYVLILMRADNKGEGGILTLVVLAEQALRQRRSFVLILGVIGAAFFFGDAMITPAISVLSAVEGLAVVNPGFDSYVVPITLVILATLFAFQFRGTGSVASLFAPITTIWFIVIAVLGLVHIGDDPAIFHALNPIYALKLVIFNPGM